MIEIIYNGGAYDIRADGVWIDSAPTYADAYQIEASYQEAKASATMGGDPLLIEAQRFGERGLTQCPCGQDALYFVQYRHTTYGYCPDCWAKRRREDDYLDDFETRYAAYIKRYPIDAPPLLAQCAAVLDSLLGGPVAGGGILDEVRRVRAALKEQGW